MFGLFDKGGYTAFDISIYGRHRFGLEYEYIRTYPSGFRQTIGLKSRIIQGAHPFVKPFRDILKGLYSDHLVNQKNSILSKWVQMIEDLLQS